MTSSNLPTLADVGRAAGVSRGTVSNVFNHPELVRPDVRERVEEAARRLGYDGPDPRGKLLQEGRFNAIGLVPPGAYSISEMIRSPYGRELVLGASLACDEAEVTLSLINGNDITRAASIRKALVDGFILGSSADIDTIASVAKRRRLPFVVLDSDVGPEVNSIRVDGRGGALEVVRYLAAHGHRRFAILSVRRTQGPPIVHMPGHSQSAARGGFPFDLERLQGFAEGLREIGQSLHEVPVIETMPGDPSAGAFVFDHAPQATAIMTMSDWQAITVLDEASRRGIIIPADVSVVGFDGTAEAAHRSIPLTTVAHDIVCKGRLAAELVLADGPPKQFVLPTQLVIRSTAGPLSRKRIR